MEARETATPVYEGAARERRGRGRQRVERNVPGARTERTKGGAALQGGLARAPAQRADGACAQGAVGVDEEVHGQHAHRLGDNEGQRAAVKAPAVPVTPLRLALVRVPRIRRDVHDDANYVAEA